MHLCLNIVLPDHAVLDFMHFCIPTEDKSQMLVGVFIWRERGMSENNQVGICSLF